ncbi:MAG: MutS family DNA mismatch repair protein [Flavisolibacter sp.]
MEKISPLAIYSKELEKQLNILAALEKKGRLLGWYRFIVFIIASIASYKIFLSFGPWGIGVILIGLGALLFLVSLDSDNKAAINNIKTLIRINKEEISLLNNQYQERPDGSIFINSLHDYANDLDLFGPSSLFQYLNRAYSEQGKALMAKYLLEASPLAQIYQRQEATQEILSDFQWRQQFQAYSMQCNLSTATQHNITHWLGREATHFTSPFWKMMVPLWSVFTLSSLGAALLGYIPASIFSFLFVLYLIISGSIVSRGAKDYSALSGIIKEIKTLYNLLGWIETKEFNASLWEPFIIKKKIKGKSPSTQIKKLALILNRFDILLNMVASTFLNSFLLWGVRQIIDLNEWRIENKQSLTIWFDLIAHFEMIHSLAVLRFNQPQWGLPTFSGQYFTLNALELGHPLIATPHRVVNDFHLEGKGKIGLITGSNMAGKSTFLRSLGINIILAQLGGVVCAKKLLISPVRLMSSMRISDNLAENTSTFYAELKKLKTIIDAVNRKEPVLILLDEILRGTNSLDRLAGSKALIIQLIKNKTVAVIATHDLALTEMKGRYDKAIENYHFDVQVEGEELYFDYLLKEGICSSLNASILMKKIGIDLSSSE